MKNNSKDKLHSLARDCESTAKILKALAHPHRLQILCQLASGEKTVGELERLCDVSQSAVSQFLGRMKSEGLITSNKEGLFVRYRISDQRILKTMNALQRIFCS